MPTARPQLAAIEGHPLGPSGCQLDASQACDRSSLVNPLTEYQLDAAHAIAPRFHLDDRRRALAVATRVLLARQPAWRAACTLRLGAAESVDAYVEFRFPGFVQVTLCDTGELIAQCVPGRPFELDLTLFPSPSTTAGEETSVPVGVAGDAATHRARLLEVANRMRRGLHRIGS